MSDQIIADRYKVLSKLGSGGSAVVYKVLDLTLNKECALKTIKVRQADSKLLVRFQREAKAVSSLRHPNIVSILDFGLDKSNNPFLVMDFVEGQSLRDYVKEHGPLSVPQAMNVFIQICDAMSYTHQHNILHRDLKSANLIVSVKSDNCKNIKDEPDQLIIRLLDFGLAKDTEVINEESLTQTGVSLGTPTYMSPEQATGKTLDERSEVYSLGCVMFESLTGKLPLIGNTVFETINKQINEEAPSLGALAEIDFPPIVESIVAKSLKKDPEKRYQSMEEFNAALESVVELLQPSYEEASEEETKDYKKAVFKIVRLGPKLLIPFAIVLFVGTKLVVSRIDSASKKPSIAVERKVEFDKLNYISKFEDATWELGIRWHKKYGTLDKDLLHLNANQGIENLALYKEKKFTNIGLKHVLSLPLVGIGYGNSCITNEQLKMTIEAKPNLKHLYIGGLPSLQDEDLKLVSKLENLRFLGISRSNFTDDGLKHLSTLKKLDTLKASKTPKIKGTGLKYLKDLPLLKRLSIGNNNYNNEGWKELSKLENLTLVSIPRTQLTDQSIKYLTTLKKLKKLNISHNTLITDNGFKQLKKLTHLEVLFIKGCRNVSPYAIEELKKSLPDCDIDIGSHIHIEDEDPMLMTEKLYAR